MLYLSPDSTSFDFSNSSLTSSALISSSSVSDEPEPDDEPLLLLPLDPDESCSASSVFDFYPNAGLNPRACFVNLVALPDSF